MTVLLASIYFLLADHSRLAPDVREIRPLPEEIATRFACDPAVPLKVELGDAKDGAGRPVLRGRASFQRIEQEGIQSVRFDYYRAPEEAVDAVRPRPAVVISPITGGDYEVSRLIARDLTAHGYHAVIVKRPDNERALRTQAKLPGFEAAMRNGLAARMRVIDWLLTRPEVDPSRIGSYGVSLGGVLAAGLAAVDDRITATIIVMGCGDLPALLARSIEREPRRLVRAHGVPDDPGPADVQAFEKIARPVLQSDPVLLAPHVDPRSVFQVITRRDLSVPSDLQERLHQALGSPEVLRLPTGHYSSAAYLPVILESSRAFLARRFAIPARTE